MLAGVLVRITQITEVSCHGLLECIHNTVFLSCHLVAHVNLGEAEGAEMRVGALHRRLDGLSEQLLHKLADKRPHLLHRLRKGKEKNHVGERIRYKTSKSHSPKSFSPQPEQSLSTDACSCWTSLMFYSRPGEKQLPGISLQTLVCLLHYTNLVQMTNNAEIGVL